MREKLIMKSFSACLDTLLIFVFCFGVFLISRKLYIK